MTILDEIAAYTKDRIEEAKREVSLDTLREQAYSMERGNFAFEKALRKPGLSFICECKKASPSKGVIAEDFPYLDIAKEYEAAGADCISVLTEPKWFLGRNRYAKEIAEAVSIPVLRKDFTIDEYMIYEAKVMGASAVLLIVSILSDKKLVTYLEICRELGLSALVETHDETEIRRALSAGAKIIGVNNRNLKDFSVDTSLALKMRKTIPSDVVFVSESGVQSAEDVKNIRESGADAVLIGEMLMRSPDKRAALDEMKEGIPKIKLCGLTRKQDIECANSLGADYIGFVFAKGSKRYISPENAGKLKGMLAKNVHAVGVFVDEEPDIVAEIANKGIIDIIQLHGNEDDAYINNIRKACGKTVIKAFSLENEEDVRMAVSSKADYILVDSGQGSGNTFDWSLLNGIDRDYFLAGGLNPQNVGDAVKKLHPYAVDVSSGIETEGIKDESKMSEFVRIVRGGNR